MNCEWAERQVDAYEVDALDDEARARFEAHTASCERCRRLAAGARASDGAVRAALAWAEPDPAFARRIAAQARHTPRRWCVVSALAVAAAAAAYVALLPGVRGPRRPPRVAPRRSRPEAVEAAAAEGLLAGELRTWSGRAVDCLERGRPYVAAANTAIGLDGRSLFLFTPGSEFASAPDPQDDTLAMSVLSGTMVAQVARRKGEAVTVQLGPELGGAVARTKGCQFYSTGIAAADVARGLGPVADELAEWPEDVRIHVFSGTLELDLGVQRLTLNEGDSCIISGGLAAGTTRELEARIHMLRQAIGEEVLARRRRYRRLRRYYGRRLVQLRALKSAGRALYLVERIELVERLLYVHARALSSLEAEHPTLFELDAAENELRELQHLRDEADDGLEQLVRLISTKE